MADKSFKVKDGLIVPSLSTAGIVKTSSSGVITSSATLSISEGGTGQTTAGNALNALLPLQTDNTNKYLQTNGVSTQWNAISGFKPEVNSAISTNQTLAAGYRYFVDTSSARTLTLPASPSVGDEIVIFDSTGAAATNNITVNSNSGKINGTVQNAIIDINDGVYSFIYTGSARGWKFV
jgi:hypothetical protein